MKYYEPEGFEKNYRTFLKGKIGIESEESERKNGGYIDPDIVNHVGKTDFYNDLTDFLNGREDEYWKDKKNEEKYYFLPPSKARKTSAWLEEHNDWLKDHKYKKESMDLTKIIVFNESNNSKLFRLTSDQFGFSAAESIYAENNNGYPLVKLLYLCKEKDKDEQERIIDRIVEYVKNTRTIGGSFLWPIPPEGNRDCPYNTNRGVSCSGYLEDRVDLTLLEVKHALDGKYENENEKENYKSDKLYKQYGNTATHMKKWFKHFDSFKAYIEYFMLEPFCQRVIKGDKKDYDYVPINIIDGSVIDDSVIDDNETPYSQKYKKYENLENAKKFEEAKKFKEENGLKKVKDLDEKEILNMLDRLEGMILVRTANMENAIETYRENWKDKGTEKK